MVVQARLSANNYARLRRHGSSPVCPRDGSFSILTLTIVDISRLAMSAEERKIFSAKSATAQSITTSIASVSGSRTKPPRRKDHLLRNGRTSRTARRTALHHRRGGACLLAVLFAQRGGIEIQPCFCSLDRIRCIGVDSLVIVGSARSLDWRCPERAAVDLRPSTRRLRCEPYSRATSRSAETSRLTTRECPCRQFPRSATHRSYCASIR